MHVYLRAKRKEGNQLVNKEQCSVPYVLNGLGAEEEGPSIDVH